MPVSLKDTPNAKQISKHEALPGSDPMALPGGTGVNTIAHVQSPQFSANKIIDFVNNSKSNIFQENVFKAILIDTKDGNRKRPRRNRDIPT